MPDVISLGEALIDMFADPVGKPMKEASHFIHAPGGAPANVAVALARLGVDVGFVGFVGDDPFGDWLIELLQSAGVDTLFFRKVASSFTTIALVAAASPTEQEFILCRGADTLLRATDLDRDYLASAKVLVYGSVTLTEGSREAAQQAIKWANQDGVLVAYDANLRPALWPSLEAARQGILAGLQGVDICKVNETELALLTGTDDVYEGSHVLLDRGIKLCLVTLGEKGAYYNNGRAANHIPAFKVNPVDTTGSGDAILAGLIAGLLKTETGPEFLDEETLSEIVRFASAAAALNATHKGAMAALPTRAAVEAFLRDQK